jgi:hypothetical protein
MDERDPNPFGESTTTAAAGKRGPAPVRRSARCVVLRSSLPVETRRRVAVSVGRRLIDSGARAVLSSPHTPEGLFVR